MIGGSLPDPQMNALMQTIHDNFVSINEMTNRKEAGSTSGSDDHEITEVFQKNIAQATHERSLTILSAVKALVESPKGISTLLHEFLNLERNCTSMVHEEAIKKLATIETTLMALQKVKMKEFVKLETEQNISERLLAIIDRIHSDTAMVDLGETGNKDLHPQAHPEQPFAILNSALVKWKIFHGCQTADTAKAAVLKMRGMGASYLWFDPVNNALMITIKRKEGNVDHFVVNLKTMLDDKSPSGLSSEFFDFLHAMGGTLSLLVAKHPTKSYDRLVTWKHYSELEESEILKALETRPDGASIVWYDQESDLLSLLMVEKAGDDYVHVEPIFLETSWMLDPKSLTGMSDKFFEFLDKIKGTLTTIPEEFPKLADRAQQKPKQKKVTFAENATRRSIVDEHITATQEKTKTVSRIRRKSMVPKLKSKRNELNELVEQPTIDRNDFGIFLAMKKLIKSNFLAGEIYSYIRSLSDTDLQKSDLLTPLLEQIHRNRVDVDENTEHYQLENTAIVDQLVTDLFNHENFKSFLAALQKQKG